MQNDRKKTYPVTFDHVSRAGARAGGWTLLTNFLIFYGASMAGLTQLASDDPSSWRDAPVWLGGVLLVTVLTSTLLTLGAWIVVRLSRRPEVLVGRMILFSGLASLAVPALVGGPHVTVGARIAQALMHVATTVIFWWIVPPTIQRARRMGPWRGGQAD